MIRLAPHVVCMLLALAAPPARHVEKPPEPVGLPHPPPPEPEPDQGARAFVALAAIDGDALGFAPERLLFEKGFRSVFERRSLPLVRRRSRALGGGGAVANRFRLL